MTSPLSIRFPGLLVERGRAGMGGEDRKCWLPDAIGVAGVWLECCHVVAAFLDLRWKTRFQKTMCCCCTSAALVPWPER